MRMRIDDPPSRVPAESSSPRTAGHTLVTVSQAERLRGMLTRSPLTGQGSAKRAPGADRLTRGRPGVDWRLPGNPRKPPAMSPHGAKALGHVKDHLPIRINSRPRPLRIALPRRRYRAGHRLPHRPPMHMMPVSQLPDRRSARSPVPPDLLEQLHPRPRHPRPPRRQQRREDQNQGGAKIRDDTPPTTERKSPPRRGQNSRRKPGQPGPVQVTTLKAVKLSPQSTGI